MAAMVDLKRRRRRVMVTAIVLAVLAMSFYFGFILSMAMRG
jgi:hypothetical protein